MDIKINLKFFKLNSDLICEILDAISCFFTKRKIQVVKKRGYEEK